MENFLESIKNHDAYIDPNYEEWAGFFSRDGLKFYPREKGGHLKFHRIHSNNTGIYKWHEDKQKDFVFPVEAFLIVKNQKLWIYDINGDLFVKYYLQYDDRDHGLDNFHYRVHYIDEKRSRYIQSKI